MKKTFLKSAVLAIAGVGLLAGSAMALPWDGLSSDWVVSDSMDYWASLSGPSFYGLMFEDASYESGFGLYTIDSAGNVDTNVELFAPEQEPLNGNSSNLGQQFGFYFDVYQSGNYAYTFYTDSSLNTAEAGVEHIMTAYNDSTNMLFIYLDDQIGNRDGDFNDMVVLAANVAPVPEPATMLLFGTGLAGLAGVARRKKAQKK